MSINGIQTVNVVVSENNIVDNIFSYKDNERGNKKAEAKFSAICKELHPTITDDDLNDALEDGYLETILCSVCLCHSIPERE